MHRQSKKQMKLINNILSLIFSPSSAGGDVGGKLINLYPRVNSKGIPFRPVNKGELHRFMEQLQRTGKLNSKLLLLPNVGKFTISLGNFNPALLINGIVSRNDSSTNLFEGRNHRMNRYLIYSYYRLFKLHEGNKMAAFWSFSLRLISSSAVYIIVCQHSVNRNLYRDLSLHDMQRLYKRLTLMRGDIRQLVRSGKVQKGWLAQPGLLKDYFIDFKRVYIPKGETYRPLGVPTIA